MFILYYLGLISLKINISIADILAVVEVMYLTAVILRVIFSYLIKFCKPNSRSSKIIANIIYYLTISKGVLNETFKELKKAKLSQGELKEDDE